MEGLWALEEFYDLFKPSQNADQKRARVVLGALFEDRTPLGQCFSEKRDLLSQWRGYADEGRGICVSFDLKFLKDLAKSNSLQLERVSYDCATFDNRSFGEELHACFNQKAVDYSDGQDGGASFEFLLQELDYQAIEQLYQYKNPAFSEESEWRLLAFAETLSKDADIGFRLGPNGFSTYLKLPIPKDAISHVTLGPCHPSSENVVRRMLTNFGVSAHISKSAASYR